MTNNFRNRLTAIRNALSSFCLQISDLTDFAIGEEELEICEELPYVEGKCESAVKILDELLSATQDAT